LCDTEAWWSRAPVRSIGSATENANELLLAGLIKYARGHITVLDRPGLERRTCDYYEVVRKEYHRLIPDRIAT
jgi:hypothetical protein